MEPVVIRCPSCNAALEGSMEFGFCKYCGNKVVIPRSASSVSQGTGVSKFYLLVYQKGEQVQYAIKDEVTIDVKYRKDATFSNPNPLHFELSSNGIDLPSKIVLPSAAGIGRIQIFGSDHAFSLTKEQKINLNINGEPLLTNSATLYYGDLISIGNAILRVQPLQT